MFESNNDNEIIDSDNCKEDEEEVCEAEDVVVEPMENFEKMKEEILCERMVSCTFLWSMYPLLTSPFSHCKNTSIREKIHICKTYGQCLSLAKSRTSQQGRLRRANSTMPACMYLHFHIIIKLLTGLSISANGYCQDNAFLKGANSNLHMHISW